MGANLWCAWLFCLGWSISLIDLAAYIFEIHYYNFQLFHYLLYSIYSIANQAGHKPYSRISMISEMIFNAINIAIHFLHLSYKTIKIINNSFNSLFRTWHQFIKHHHKLISMRPFQILMGWILKRSPIIVTCRLKNIHQSEVLWK